MKSTSKVIIGAALIMVISLAIILGLLLVLLAELYCSLLLRRRQLQHTTSATTTTTTASMANSAVENTISISTSSTPPPPLNQFYSQGVLSAPSFIFPRRCNKFEHKAVDVENPPHRSQLRQFLESNVVNYSINNIPHSIGILSSFPSSSPHTATYICDDSDSSQKYVNEDKLVYISNPIYDNHVVVDTPFETPDTSPSRLDTLSGSSGDDDDDKNAGKSCTQANAYDATTTPPLTPIKKLPAQACSVSLTDARSFNTSVTDSKCHNNGETSSSSGSPRPSPSW